MAEKAKTLNQLAAEYGVHVSTLRNWLKPIKEEVYEGKRKLLLPRQYKKIYEFLGEPDF
jgi:transposase-like protein